MKLLAVGCLMIVSVPDARAQADLYIQDTAADTGVEPNPDPGPMWVSQDIWVLNTPDVNYDPRPFPTAAPPWVPPAHQNPEYDDPKYGFPAYIYVRIRNRGNQVSSGSERLRVYWAKASTGLGWPTQWVDYFDNTCGSTELYGLEVTKPRKNAATASAAERTAYLNALLDIDANALLQFTDGTQYWDKQNSIHDVGGALHGVPGFLPWHREFLNRLEALLRESNPALTLMYWDWTTDPRTGFGVNLFTTSFMGSSSGAVGAPLGPLQPPNLSRDVGFFGFAPDSDAAITGELTFPSMSGRLEATPNHNSAHGYIGGASGNISFLSTAAQDPFFFFLHGNVDKIWAAWQRDPNSPERLDTATTYGTDSGHSSIVNDMSPWDGGTSLSPWTNPSQQAFKPPTHYSVVAPPVYDTAPLMIPVLQPEESCIIQIPWFPPDPSKFACFGDPGHFCLLARIETSPTSPFGMTSPEGGNVSVNTRNNNNIAWKNITVVDNVARLRFLSTAIIRNFLTTLQTFHLKFRMAPEDANRPFFDVGRISLIAPDPFVELWLTNQMVGENIQIGAKLPDGRTELAILGDNAFMEVPLDRGVSFPIAVAFELNEQVADEDRLDPYNWDFEQVIPAEPPFIPETVVGGQRFTVDVSKFRLVDPESEWAYQDDGVDLGSGWQDPQFDDSDWKRGRGSFGVANGDRTTVNGGPPGNRHTVYFRKTFLGDRPEIYNRFRLRLRVDDGAIVYLNGEEIHRRNLPAGTVDFSTLATEEVVGLAECVYWDVDLGDALPVQESNNVMAVEVHQASLDSPDLHFDLALCANPVARNLKPDVKLLSPLPGTSVAPGTPVGVRVEAFDQDGSIAGVMFLVDGELQDTVLEPPYEILLDQLSLGSHLLTVIATDDQDAECVVSARINVADGLPPSLRIVSPARYAAFPAGEPIPVEVEVISSPSAPFGQVDLYLREGDFFPDGFNLTETEPSVASDSEAPYELSLAGLPAGKYKLQAGGTDTAGNQGSSTHRNLLIFVTPTITIEQKADEIMIAWEPAEATLESASAPQGPWVPVIATSPWTLPIQSLDPSEQYYRAALDLNGTH